MSIISPSQSIIKAFSHLVLKSVEDLSTQSGDDDNNDDDDDDDDDDGGDDIVASPNQTSSKASFFSLSRSSENKPTFDRHSQKDPHEDSEVILRGECELYIPPPLPSPMCGGCFCAGRVPAPKPGRWDSCSLELCDDSTLRLKSDKTKKTHLDTNVRLGHVIEFVAFGKFTEALPRRPDNIRDSECLLMIPVEPRINGEVYWLQFKLVETLTEWLLAIASTVPLPHRETKDQQPNTQKSPQDVTGYHVVALDSHHVTPMVSDLELRPRLSFTVTPETGADILAKFSKDHGGVPSATSPSILRSPHFNKHMSWAGTPVISRSVNPSETSSIRKTKDGCGT